MARCQYVIAEGVPVRLCAVHGGPEPCPNQDKPALPYPLHVLADPDQRDETIDLARRSMAGARPIMVHAGMAGDIGHLTQLGETECWCEYVIIPAS